MIDLKEKKYIIKLVSHSKRCSKNDISSLIIN